MDMHVLIDAGACRTSYIDADIEAIGIVGLFQGVFAEDHMLP